MFAYNFYVIYSLACNLFNRLDEKKKVQKHFYNSFIINFFGNPYTHTHTHTYTHTRARININNNYKYNLGVNNEATNLVYSR